MPCRKKKEIKKTPPKPYAVSLYLPCSCPRHFTKRTMDVKAKQEDMNNRIVYT